MISRFHKRIGRRGCDVVVIVGRMRFRMTKDRVKIERIFHQLFQVRVHKQNWEVGEMS